MTTIVEASEPRNSIVHVSFLVTRLVVGWLGTRLAALRDRYPQARIPNPVSEILMCPPLKVLIQMIQVASNSR